MIHKDKEKLKGKNILKYINEGERKGFNKRSTCASRKNWYDLGNQKSPDLLWFKAFNDRVISPVNNLGFYSSDRFYAIYLHKKKFRFPIACILNSTLAHLIVEMWGRVNLGEGALDNMTYEAASMLIIKPEFFNVMSKKVIENFFRRPISSVFNEIGATNTKDVTNEKIAADRRELDKIIMGDILGLTESEQLEVYKAVIDLVSSRLQRARSVDNNKIKDGIDFKKAKNLIIDKYKSK